jgi:hypothetical protein
MQEIHAHAFDTKAFVEKLAQRWQSLICGWKEFVASHPYGKVPV